MAIEPVPQVDKKLIPYHVQEWLRKLRTAVINSGGTVSSVALVTPAEFTVAGSPVTTSGTLSFTKAVQNANKVWAGPTSGGDAAPAFRLLVIADVPSITESKISLSDVTTDDVSITAHGFAPKAPNDTAKFLRGDATWAAANAGNLTGPITSVGLATSIAAQTGTGTTFVVQNTPTLTTPVIGAATGTSVSLSNTVSLANTGGAATAGQLTLVAGTKTVSTTAATATALIFFQRVTSGGTIGFATTYTVSAGTSFTISSDSALDTSTYNWLIVETH